LAAIIGMHIDNAGAQVVKNVDDDYPTKAVRLVVPFTPGGANDITARLIATELGQTLGRQFVIDNRGGAGGSIGAELVAKAVPDGYTLMASNPGPSVNNPIMRRRPSYRVEDFAQVAIYGYTPLIIAVHPSFGPRNARELVDYLKRNPEKLSWGSTGTGGIAHIALALFQAATGTDVIHVPYKGAGPGLNELAGGSIQLFYTTLASADTLIKAGRIRIIGIAAPKRLSGLPDVPTLSEYGVTNADVIVWYGLAAPAKTMPPIIEKLNREVNRIMKMPDIGARFGQLGIEVFGGSSLEAEEFVRNEAARLRRLMKTGLISPLD